MNSISHKFRNWIAFTIAELIIVITILAILAVIAFVSYEGYTASARDSQRLSNIKNIETGLALYGTKTGIFPMPDPKISGGVVLTGSIAGISYAYLGVVGNAISQVANINKAPTDPTSADGYLYGISNNGKYFQVATVMEKTQVYTSLATDTAHAASSATLKAKVLGNYPGYIQFNVVTSTGTDTYITNIPSLLWNNTGSVILFSTGGISTYTDASHPTSPYFVVNQDSNLPYTINNEPIGDKDFNIIMQSITGTGVATLTGVNISSVIRATPMSAKQQAIQDIFGTGATPASQTLLANFGGTLDIVQAKILWSSATQTYAATTLQAHSGCILSGTTVLHGQSITTYSESVIPALAVYACSDRQQTRTCIDGTLSWDASYQHTTCVKGTPNNCSANTNYTYNGHTYSIPALNHGSGATNLISSSVGENHGTFHYTLSTIDCNDGIYASVNENATPTIWSCDTGYTQSGNICIQNSCATQPSYAHATFTSGTPTSPNQAWQNTSNANPCYYVCTGGYTGVDCGVTPILDWKLIDTNCIKSNITIGSQTWAGCNSTKGTMTQTYTNGGCYDYTGNPTLGNSCYGATTTEGNAIMGQSDNIYGGLYQWYYLPPACLANHDSGILPITNTACPCQNGYHIPSNTEWDTLETTLGCIEKLTGASTGWECMTNNTADVANGLGWTSTRTNSLKNKLGFPLAGYCDDIDSCSYRGQVGSYWSSTSNSSDVWSRSLIYSNASVSRGLDDWGFVFSVRCIKD